MDDHSNISRVALGEKKAAFQLYSLATPNGQKVGILLEELLAGGQTLF